MEADLVSTSSCLTRSDEIWPKRTSMFVHASPPPRSSRRRSRRAARGRKRADALSPHSRPSGAPPSRYSSRDRCRRSRSRSFTDGHSAAMTENMAESRSRPSSPGACERAHWRRTPSNCAPRASIAARDTLRSEHRWRSRHEQRQVTRTRVSEEEKLGLHVDAGSLRRGREPGPTDHHRRQLRRVRITAEVDIGRAADERDRRGRAPGRTAPSGRSGLARGGLLSKFGTSAAAGTDVKPFELRPSSTAAARSLAWV